MLTSLASQSLVAQIAAKFDPKTGQAILTSGRLELLMETRPGLNPRSLRDLGSHDFYADADYVWPGGQFPRLLEPPAVDSRSDQTASVRLRARLDSLEVEQSFVVTATEPGTIFETIVLRNPTDQPLSAADFKCGFAKRIRNRDGWLSDAVEWRFCPVPYRRETDGAMREYPLREIAEHGLAYSGWAEPPVETPTWGAEAWVWSQAKTAFLIAKHNPDAMEWSLMEPVKRPTATLLRFGGAGQWKHGHPEGSTILQPGQSFRFGETRLQLIEGDWKQAYYAYRGYCEAKGCRPPKGYLPPVHWNELYDNEYFFKVGPLCFQPDFNAKNEPLLNKLYTLDLMKAEAAKAKDLGCEALYLDPGWDTGPSHHIWGASRLGSMESFMKLLRQEYGLGLSLWIGLGGVPPTYADPEACPVEARVRDKDGQRTNIHCVASPAFLATKEQRLTTLCRQGVSFLMFDSTQYSGPCYDPTHHHQIPATREEHAQALRRLARDLKHQFPATLIEMHDFISGPSGVHYTPTYFGYAPPASFDCLWGHEFMWDSMQDLVSGRAVSLYYFNLAYSIPLYLHINLKQENENALLFWWYASTCRHLGLGGKPRPAVWDALKRAMQTYLPLKRFYAQGAFYGLDETIHAHTLPDLQESIINVFNLADQPARKQIHFRPEEVGLPSGAVQIENTLFQRNGKEVAFDLDVPARGHRLLKVRMAATNR